MKSGTLFFVRQLLLAATISLGFGTIWLVLALFLGTLALEAWQQPDVKWPPREELVVKRDGTPLIKSSPRGVPSQQSYRGLDDQPEPKHGRLLDAVYLTGGGWVRPSWYSELDWQFRLKPFVDPAHSEVVWYFLHNGAPEGVGYFAGFDRRTSRPVGFIGESGFRSSRPPPPEQFAVRSGLMVSGPFWSPSQFVLSQARVIELDSLNSPIPPSTAYVPCSDRLVLVDLSTPAHGAHGVQGRGAHRVNRIPHEDFRQPRAAGRQAGARAANHAKDRRIESRPRGHQIFHHARRVSNGKSCFLVSARRRSGARRISRALAHGAGREHRAGHLVSDRGRRDYSQPNGRSLAKRHVDLEQTEGVFAPGRGAAGAFGLAHRRVVLRDSHPSGTELFGCGTYDDRIVMAVIAGCGDLGAVAFDRLVAKVTSLRPTPAAPGGLGDLRLSVRHARLCGLSPAPALGGAHGVPKLSCAGNSRSRSVHGVPHRLPGPGTEGHRDLRLSAIGIWWR